MISCAPTENSEIGLYIHIPFCKSKCSYCDFNSYSGMESLIPQYFEALEKEIVQYSLFASDRTIKSIFIGGGTPSLTEASYIVKLLTLVRNIFDISNGAEITIESNPGTLTEDKLAAYYENGINRISIGLQAYQDRILKKIGRIHTNSDFFESIYLAKHAGFNNINADLIFGLPGQVMSDWKETIQAVLAADINHLSCYSLIIEEGTAMYEQVKSGVLSQADDDLDREMYHYTISELGNNGFKHYEISNFAKEGYECVHNLIYWETGEYIGVGAGAHSYLNKERYKNAESIERYIHFASSNGINREDVQYIDKKSASSEFIIMGLRLIKGINLKSYSEKFGQDIDKAYPGIVEHFIQNGLLKIEDGYLKLTAMGLDLANIVMMEFL